MNQLNRTTHILFGLLILQTGLLLGASWPSAQADDHEETEAPAVEVQPTPQELVCRYFELDEDDLRADAHGEINTRTPTGDVEKFLKGDHALLEPHSMDFEMGQSLSGKPTYWVQICLRSP